MGKGKIQKHRHLLHRLRKQSKYTLKMLEDPTFYFEQHIRLKVDRAISYELLMGSHGPTGFVSGGISFDDLIKHNQNNPYRHPFTR